MQLLPFDYIRLLNKPYANGVTLREQIYSIERSNPFKEVYKKSKGSEILDWDKIKIQLYTKTANLHFLTQYDLYSPKILITKITIF